MWDIAQVPFQNRIEHYAGYTACNISAKNFLVIRITRKVSVKVIHGEKYICTYVRHFDCTWCIRATCEVFLRNSYAHIKCAEDINAGVRRESRFGDIKPQYGMERCVIPNKIGFLCGMYETWFIFGASVFAAGKRRTFEFLTFYQNTLGSS